MNNITTGQDLAARLESNFRFFQLPVLEIGIKYRRPNLLKASLNHQLPTFMADAVIDAYKEAMSGSDLAAYQRSKETEKADVTNETVKDISEKGYVLLSDLCVSHTILNGKSDPENNVIGWEDIPEEDAIAFLLQLLEDAKIAQTKDGGTVTSDDVTKFSDVQRGTKRRNARQNG